MPIQTERQRENDQNKQTNKQTTNKQQQQQQKNNQKNRKQTDQRHQQRQRKAFQRYSEVPVMVDIACFLECAAVQQEAEGISVANLSVLLLHFASAKTGARREETSEVGYFTWERLFVCWLVA